MPRRKPTHPENVTRVTMNMPRELHTEAAAIAQREGIAVSEYYRFSLRMLRHMGRISVSDTVTILQGDKEHTILLPFDLTPPTAEELEGILPEQVAPPEEEQT